MMFANHYPARESSLKDKFLLNGVCKDIPYTYSSAWNSVLFRLEPLFCIFLFEPGNLLS